ncbi:WD40-repeat-containing domain protein [Cladochytrium replicatum]|nr:WD40-repeat-containing domain protein [Cladochytrium replicatum]
MRTRGSFELKGARLAQATAVAAEESVKHGLRIAVGHADGSIRLWNSEWALQKAARVELDKNGSRAEIADVCVRSDSKSNCLYAAAGFKVYKFDLAVEDLILNVPVKTYQHASDEINKIAINEKGSYLATADDSGNVCVIDVLSGVPFKRLRTAHTNICMTVSFRPRKPWEVISGAMDHTLIRWDFSSGSPFETIDMATAAPATGQTINPPWVNCTAVSSKGNMFAAGLGDGTIAVMEIVSSGKRKERIRNPIARLSGESSDNHEVVGHSWSVTAVCFPSGEDYCIVSGGLDGKLCIWTRNANGGLVYKLSHVEVVERKVSGLFARWCDENRILQVALTATSL